MKKTLEICAMALLGTLFLLTPAAMAVVVMGGEQAFAPFSEQGAMILPGASLISVAGLCRKRVPGKD